MELVIKEVWFDEYCPKCKHYELKETEEPCNECLTNGANEYSHKPIMFISKEDK